MKKRLSFILLALGCAGALAARTPGAQPGPQPDPQLPPRDQTLQTMLRVNDYFMQKYADPTLPIHNTQRTKVYESNLWTRAVYYEGLMALYGIAPENRYYDYAVAWAEHHKWGMRRDQTSTRNADNYCCAQTYIDLYRLTPRPEWLTKTRAAMNMLVNTPQADDWTWIDAIQMGMPVLVKLGTTTGDGRYCEKAWEMYAWSRNTLGLFNPEVGLWWRDKDFLPPYREPNGAGCYWSRGNGWVAAALVRVLDELPADAPHRDRYTADLQAMCRALAACQREDGFWNVSLHDPDHFGGPETSGTALFVYAMAWGIRHGLLDRATYLPVVARAWQALSREAVRDDGFLGYVQGTGKQPSDGQPVGRETMPDFEDYGAGCLLLAGAEVYKLQ